jgi:hypothetical protein
MPTQPIVDQDSDLRLDDLFSDPEPSHYSAVNACVNACYAPSDSGMGDALVYPVDSLDQSH